MGILWVYCDRVRLSLHADGFINRIMDCNFIGSSIAVKSANQANSVIISNNNFEGQVHILLRRVPSPFVW